MALIRTLAAALAALGPLLAAAPTLAQPWPVQTDYVCAAKSSGGDDESQRVRVDMKNKAWCTSKDECKEIKTIFGEKGDKVLLESSQLEVTSYETSIDRKTGAFDSVVTTGGFTSETHGTCKPAAFTPFAVTVDGSKIRGG